MLFQIWKVSGVGDGVETKNEEEWRRMKELPKLEK
jgi:hypothetical protein